MSSLPNEKDSIVQMGGVRPPGQKKQIITVLIVIAVLIAGGTGAWLFLKSGDEAYILRDWESARVSLGTYNEVIQASGTVEVPRQVNLPNQQEGYAENLYVTEGQAITSEVVLASLEIPSLEDELEDYLADLETAKLNLNQTLVQDRYNTVEQKTVIERLKEDIKDAEEEVTKKTELVALNASRQSELEVAEDALENLEENLIDAELVLEELEEINGLTVLSLEASIKQLETKILRTREDLEEANLRSPIAGEILFIDDSLSVAGGLIEQNTTLFTIADRSSAVIELEVYEQYSAYLTAGQELLITVGDSTIFGIIESIGQYAVSSSDGLGSSVTVTVTPDQSDGYLTPGTTAVTELSLGEREDVMLLPRDAWLTTGSQKWVYAIKDGRAKKTRVTLGDIGDSQVEIVSGLQAGDEVIISGYQNFIEYETLELKEN